MCCNLRDMECNTLCLWTSKLFSCLWLLHLKSNLPYAYFGCLLSCFCKSGYKSYSPIYIYGLPIIRVMCLYKIGVKQHWCGCDSLVIWLLLILQQLHDEYHWATTDLNLGTNAFPNSQTPFSKFTVLPWDLFSNASDYLQKHRNSDEGNKLKS